MIGPAVCGTRYLPKLGEIQIYISSSELLFWWARQRLLPQGWDAERETERWAVALRI